MSFYEISQDCRVHMFDFKILVPVPLVYHINDFIRYMGKTTMQLKNVRTLTGVHEKKQVTLYQK